MVSGDLYRVGDAPAIEGENIESDQPNRLAMTFHAVWDDDVRAAADAGDGRRARPSLTCPALSVAGSGLVGGAHGRLPLPLLRLVRGERLR